MFRKTWALLALCLCFAGSAQAQFYAGLEGSATRLDEPRWRGRGVGLILGWTADDSLAFELGWRRLGSDAVLGERQAGALLEGTALWRVPLGGSMNAYARAGLAQLRGQLADSTSSGGKLRPLLGLGLHMVLVDNWALRAEAQRVGKGVTGLRLGIVHRF